MKPIARILQWSAAAALALTAQVSTAAPHSPSQTYSSPDAAKLTWTASRIQREFTQSLRERHQWPAYGANRTFLTALNRLECAGETLQRSLSKSRRGPSPREAMATVRQASRAVICASENVRLDRSAKHLVYGISRQVTSLDLAIRRMQDYGGYAKNSHSHGSNPVHTSRPGPASVAVKPGRR